MSQDRDAKKPLVELAPEETTLPALSQSAHPVEFIEANEPLVELAPEESVLPALQQSAHPVEFIEANETREGEASEQDAS
jgi:hypothetical protein